MVTGNCSSFTVEELKFFNRLRNVTAIHCALITMIILLYLIYSKAYSTLFQRLYLYLVIGTLLCETSLSITLEHQWEYPGQGTVCTWVGFFTYWSYLQVTILSYENIVYLFYIVISKIKGAQAIFPKWIGESTFCGVIVESVYIAVPVVISTILAVLAYVHHSYGVSGPWCWLRSLNDECEPVGFASQIGFLGVYIAIGIVGMAVSIVFAVVYLKLSNRYNIDTQLLLKKTLIVMTFQLFHILSGFYSLAVRLQTLLTQQYNGYALWFIHALHIPFGALLLPLGYLLAFYSTKRTILLVTTCRRLLQKDITSVSRQNNGAISKGATAPLSDRISPPSLTCFTVLHPDRSSDISKESTLILDLAGGENN